MSENYIRNVVEAALLAAGRPLQLTELAQLFDESSRPEPPDLRAALDALQADYGARGIEVKETATGFRIQVKRELANEVSRLWPERPPRYSRALLETLALIAYRQPITRAEIEAVRGVAVNPNIIKTVLERGWVRVVGTRDVPGRPELLGTTKEFLDYFGLRSLEDLPPLSELKAMGEINLQLDLAKPDSGSGGGGSEGSGGAGGTGGAAPADANGSGSAVAAASAVAAVGVAAGVAEAASEAESSVTSASTPDAADAVAAEHAPDAENAVASDAADAVASESASGAENASDFVSAPDGEGPSVDGGPGQVPADSDSNAGEDDIAGATVASLSRPAIEGSLDAVDHTAQDADLVAMPAETDDFVVAEVTPASASTDEADSGDVTVEVETLGLIEARIEASIEASIETSIETSIEPSIEPSIESAEVPPREDAAIETGQFELAELGMSPPPSASVLEAEFDVEDLESTASEEEASDDEEELSAGPQSSTELVASPPRDRDD